MLDDTNRKCADRLKYRGWSDQDGLLAVLTNMPFENIFKALSHESCIKTVTKAQRFRYLEWYLSQLHIRRKYAAINIKQCIKVLESIISLPWKKHIAIAPKKYINSFAWDFEPGDFIFHLTQIDRKMEQIPKIINMIDTKFNESSLQWIQELRDANAKRTQKYIDAQRRGRHSHDIKSKKIYINIANKSMPSV